jgi:hypothetical protein
MHLDGLDGSLSMLGESVSVVEDDHTIGSRYAKFIQICKKIDDLENNKKLSAADLMTIDLVLNNVFRTLDDMVEMRTKPLSQSEITAQKTG